MTDFKTVLEKNGVLVFTNKGVSMMPLLRQGRDVMVIRAKTSGFQKNDAVLFIRPNGQYILHRIRKILPDGSFDMIGDNCERGEVVRPEQIIGILTEVRRDGKTIPVDSPKMRRYIRTVPVRRFFFSIYRTVFRFLYAVYCRTLRPLIRRDDNKKAP